MILTQGHVGKLKVIGKKKFIMRVRTILFLVKKHRNTSHKECFYQGHLSSFKEIEKITWSGVHLFYGKTLDVPATQELLMT